MTREELEYKIILFVEERNSQPVKYHKEYNKSISIMRKHLAAMQRVENKLQELEKQATIVYRDQCV